MILCTYCYLQTYNNDLSQGLPTDIKPFADDTSLFLVVDGIDESASKLNNDLIGIQKLNYQWEMSVNLDKVTPVQLYYLQKQKKYLYMLISILTTSQLLKQHLKNTWD